MPAKADKDDAATADKEPQEAPKMAPRMAPPMMGPTAVAKLPTRFVKLPSRVVAEPPIVTNSEEDRLAEEDVMIQKDIHVLKPMVNQHLIKKNLMINN